MIDARTIRGAGSEAGQSTVLAVLFMVALIAMMAAVLDVGSWMRSDRNLQAEADAAALAAAQELPDAPATAVAKAIEYGVVLAVITLGVVVALTALSGAISGAINSVLGFL